MVDAELTPLLVDPLLGRRAAIAEDLLVARVEPDQDELADVVEQCRRRQLVAARDLGEVGDALGRVTGRDRVAAEALGKQGPARGRLKRS